MRKWCQFTLPSSSKT